MQNSSHWKSLLFTFLLLSPAGRYVVAMGVSPWLAHMEILDNMGISIAPAFFLANV